MKTYAFGVDVGGTTVKIGLLEEDGTLCESWEIPTRTQNGGVNILPDIAASIQKSIKKNKLTEKQICGIGMGVPGPVSADGTVNKCVNLGWDVFNVEKGMEVLTGFPTRVGNDANMAALGEMWMGGGKGFLDLVVITLGTGIGAGVIVDGRILSGFNGAAGEIGHMPMREDETEFCGCGKRGCLEQYASANGIARVAKKYLNEHDDASVLRDLPVEEITAKEVFDAAKAEDAVGLKLVEDFGEIIGIALAQVASVTNPQVFVIGGGVSKAGPIVTDVIRKYFVPHAFHACSGAEFTLATLGNDAGIYGSAWSVLNKDKV